MNGKKIVDNGPPQWPCHSETESALDAETAQASSLDETRKGMPFPARVSPRTVVIGAENVQNGARLLSQLLR
jgi:hypothetical protein